MNYDMFYIHPNKKATGTASTEPNNTKIVRISRPGCNIHVTPAPESVIGSIDYYYDLTKADSNEDWLSRHFDFIHRHKDCQHVSLEYYQHTPPEYYQCYGDKYIRRFTDKLFPKLSERGKNWLITAKELLQRNMERGFKINESETEVITVCKKNKRYSATTVTDKVESLELTNELFTKFAFNTHPPAYIDGGLGDLPFSDLL